MTKPSRMLQNSRPTPKSSAQAISRPTVASPVRMVITIPEIISSLFISSSFMAASS